MKGRWKWKQRGWPRVVVRERMDEEFERSRESWELTLTAGGSHEGGRKQLEQAAIARGSHGRELPASSSRAGAANSGRGDG